MNIEKSIFKAYDIRGIYPEQLNEEAAYALGRAYATLMSKENPGRRLSIAVGSDMRISGPSLKERVVAGLIDSGVDVVDIGLVSTPTFYFAVGHFGYDGGLQVSASHNPKQWNGLKIVRKGSIPVSKDSGIMEMYEIIDKETFIPVASEKGSISENHSVLEVEVEEMTKFVDPSGIKPFKIVVDAANAMGSVDVKGLFSKLPCELITMNFDLDGNFPVHEADPMKDENTVDLKKRVVEEKADLGIATDGDGDRYFFIDEKGESLPQPILRGLMSQIELKANPGASVVYDIRPGRITKDMIDEVGGKGIVTPVGHSLMKEIMLKEGAIFGGESSGHYCFKLPIGIVEAPMVLVLKLLKYISEQGKPLSEIIAPYKKYFHSGEINLHISDKEKVPGLIEQVKEKYKDGNLILIDGVTVEYPDVWFNLRASNTEPVIRLAIEGVSSEAVAKKKEELMEILK